MTVEPGGIIVTGGTGFIGRTIVARLAARFGDRVPVVALGSECNLVDGTAFGVFDALRTRISADHIFHLAARAPSGEWLARHPAEGWYSNTLINANLFEAARRYFPDARVTTALSYSMYPPGDRAAREDDAVFHADDDNLAAYASVKASVLVAQDAYARQFGMQCGAVVFPTVYGPDGRRPDFAQAVPSLCRKFLDAAAGRTASVEIWGDGAQERDFLHVDDAAEGFIAAALGPRRDLLNLGSGRVVSIRDLATLIAELTGYDGPVIYDETRYAGPQRRWMDTARAEALLGWRPRVPLREGLARTLQDIRTRLADTSPEGGT